MSRPLPPLSSLRRLCDPLRASCAEVVLLEDRGNPREILVTDGHALLRLVVEEGARRRVAAANLRLESEWGPASQVCGWLALDGSGPRVTLGALRAWAGPYVGPQRCGHACLQHAACKGTGKVPGTRKNGYQSRPCACRVSDQRFGRVLRGTDTPCTYPGCDQTGHCPPTGRPGAIEGVTLADGCSLDRNLVAKFLAPLPPAWNDVTFRVGVANESTQIRFLAPDCSLVCMTYNEPPPEEALRSPLATRAADGVTP